MLVEWQLQRCSRLTDRVTQSTLISTPQPIPTIFPLAIRESIPQSFLKRPRSETDVDGEDSVDLQKKKRRLRLDLVTSRLSQPYATPTTHIISRKSRRPGPWKTLKSPLRSPLRRAAILNAIRVKRKTAKNFGPKEVNLLTGLETPKEPAHTEVDLMTQGIRSPRGLGNDEGSPQPHFPASPSPLGPSNYDALDEEDDPFEEDNGEGIDDGDSVYSNFNDLDDQDSDIEDYSTPCFFGGDEEPFEPWSPEVIPQSADVKIKSTQQVRTLPAPCAS
ncbi:MAG: hypothetical protein Q9170_007213 [Blastenia crenularia]